MKITHKNNQAGFTIVELMVATLVFSSIILVITFGVMQFSKAYYRGVTASKTQNTARSIIEAVTQSVQYSGGDLGKATAAPYQTYCLGNSQFDFRKSYMRQSEAEHVLYVSPTNTSSCSSKTFDAATSRELLDPNMRLVKFSILPVDGTTNMFAVNVRVAYGADDLLCSPDKNDCGNAGTSSNLTEPDLVCKITTGSQFCAVSELSTTIQKRIN